MVKFGVGQPARRVEDMRLISGKGRFTDDISLPNEAHAFMVRSPRAHAVITGIDTEDAKAAPGVIAVITGADAEAAGLGIVASPAADMLKNKDGTPIFKTVRNLISRDRVRHVGDTVAVIVAETAAQARDAAELLIIDYDDLPSVADTAGAIADGAPVIWEENGSNLAYDWEIGDAAKVEEGLKAAHHVTRIKLINNRIVVNAMEPRAALGHYEADRDHYTLYTGSQGVHSMRNYIAQYSLKITGREVARGDGRRGRRLRHEDLRLSRISAGALCVEADGPVGEVDGGPIRQFRHGQPGTRPCDGSGGGARQGREDTRRASVDHRQSRRLSEPVRTIHSVARAARHACRRLYGAGDA